METCPTCFAKHNPFCCPKCSTNEYVFTTDDGKKWSWAYCKLCGRIGFAYPNITHKGKSQAIKAWNWITKGES